jgi:hypothetical protein
MKGRKELPEFKEEIRALIQNRKNQILEIFASRNASRNFRAIPELFPLHSKIVTHDGEVILGRDCASYWQKVSEMAKTGPNFQDPYLDGLELNKDKELTEQDIDLSVVEITKFSFSGGTTYEGYICAIYRHIFICIPV